MSIPSGRRPGDPFAFESGTRSLCSAPPGSPAGAARASAFSAPPAWAGTPQESGPRPGGAGGDSLLRVPRFNAKEIPDGQRHPRHQRHRRRHRGTSWLRRMHDGGELVRRTNIRACAHCSHTSRGHRTDREAAGLVFEALAALADIRELLWPTSNPNASWSPDTIDEIARRLEFFRTDAELPGGGRRAIQRLRQDRAHLPGLRWLLRRQGRRGQSHLQRVGRPSGERIRTGRRLRFARSLRPRRARRAFVRGGGHRVGRGLPISSRRPPSSTRTAG